MTVAELGASRERLATEKEFHEYERGPDGSHVRTRSRYGRIYRVLDAQERAFNAAMGDLEGLRVLSYGCGTGYVTPLARLGARVTGIDISESAIDILNRVIDAEGLSDRADARVADCEQVPIPDGTFDVIVGSGILHHLDMEVACREVRRLLKPGGRALFREPLAANPGLALYRALTPGHRTPTEHPFTRKDFRLLSEVFTTVRWRGYGLTNLAALAFLPLPRVQRAVLAPLDLLDRALTAAVPPLKRLCWSALIELER